MHRYEVLYRDASTQNYSAPADGAVYIERPKAVIHNDIINVRGEAVMVDVVVVSNPDHRILGVTLIGPAQ